MKRRNLIEEIIAKRERNAPIETRLNYYKTRLDQISAASLEIAAQAEPNSKVFHQELSRYFPVALVSTIEAYFRMVIANLIDMGSPYIERASKLHARNISIEAAAAMHDRKVSLGEYISHAISLSSPEDINAVMSTLLGYDFFERLLTSEFDIFKNEQPFTLKEARGDFMLVLKKLFQTRNILCHEFAPSLIVDNTLILKSFTAIDLLIGLAEVMIWAEEKHV